MKVIILEYPDTTDLSAVTLGTIVDEANASSLVGGTLIHVGQHSNPPEPVLVPHIHPVTGEAGAPVEG